MEGEEETTTKNRGDNISKIITVTNLGTGSTSRCFKPLYATQLELQILVLLMKVSLSENRSLEGCECNQFNFYQQMHSQNETSGTAGFNSVAHTVIVIVRSIKKKEEKKKTETNFQKETIALQSKSLTPTNRM